MKENRRKAPTDDSADDADLIRLFLNGEKGAFDQLVMRHQNRVFNLCYRFFGDMYEANDMTQEIFIKAYRSMGTFRFESGFSTWLYRIAVNTCRNRLKSIDYRFKKMMSSIHGEKDSGADETIAELPDVTSSPVLALEAKESALLVQKAIDDLPHDKKAMVILRDIEGLSYEEIASISGVALGTVKSKLARARHALKKKLEGVL